MRTFAALAAPWIFSATAALAAALVPPTPRDVDAILADGLPASHARVETLLRESYKPGTGSIPSNAGQPAFRAWFNLSQWTALLAKESLVELDPSFLKQALSNPNFSEDLFLNLTEADDLTEVLKNLQTLWKLNAPQFWQYSRLALALALVYDEPPPKNWPHHQVSPSTLPGPPMTITEAFPFWIESAQSGRLYSDPKTLGVDQLKFMVDVFLPAEELRWAQKNARFPRADFGKAFSSITYDHKRLKSQQYDWPTDSYTLAEIRKLGGICVDQAYFAAMSGKANGLPTLYFSGQGADGGHAWFGYLKGANRWDLDCGRYENQGYAVGEAMDPQTWQPVTDSELSYLAKPSQRGDAFRQSQFDLGMAEIYSANQEPEKALRAVDSAIAVCPENAQAWMAKTPLLTETKVLQTHFEKALNQFPANPEMRAFFQKEMAALYRNQGDAAKAEEWERKVVSQNRNDRSDLSIAAAAEGLAALVNANQMEEAMKEYRSLLGRLGRKGGGNFYYQITAPFTESLIKAGDTKNAERAIDLARRALQPETGSILDQEIRKLSRQATGRP